ncbi:MAG: HlyD family efflux transporter periplasmic adaptor subunit [Parvularculaceae bacterium]|nr:HlyD family efflux transporter periplasmic adaptor subunit [Parvularculaceae bacterium]
MMVTIDEEAKTRVRDSYVVSAPVNGRLLRVGFDAGADVVKDETVVAEMTPVYPAALDIRTREQAEAAVEEARAGLALARAEMRRVRADAAFAEQEAARARELFKGEAIAQRGLDRAEIALTSARAALEAANAAVAMREAELSRVKATLKTPAAATTKDAAAEPIRIRAPVSGHILRIFQESEAIVAAGAPILEIGDPHKDLEVVAELLSTDAVKVSAGDPVIIDKWGGDAPLDGVVARVEPLGFTKVSALGVEEQRVNTIIAFKGRNDSEKLGDGYRVEARIVVWRSESALKVPANALFREGGDWAVYRAIDGRARKTRVEIGANNGAEAEVLSGLSAGDEVILYPGGDVADGVRVKAARAP